MALLYFSFNVFFKSYYNTTVSFRYMCVLDSKRADPFQLMNTKIVRTVFKFIDKRLFVMKKEKKNQL